MCHRLGLRLPEDVKTFFLYLQETLLTLLLSLRPSLMPTITPQCSIGFFHSYGVKLVMQSVFVHDFAIEFKQEDLLRHIALM